MSRPSLKIIRHEDRDPPGDIAFEVWDPFTANYELALSLDTALFRVGELAEQIRQMWVRHDPALASLKDAPEPADDDQAEWAEFRVSAQARLVYETRNFDEQGWKKAANRGTAIETICNDVGYVPS